MQPISINRNSWHYRLWAWGREKAYYRRQGQRGPRSAECLMLGNFTLMVYISEILQYCPLGFVYIIKDFWHKVGFAGPRIHFYDQYKIENCLGEMRIQR